MKWVEDSNNGVGGWDMRGHLDRNFSKSSAMSIWDVGVLGENIYGGNQGIGEVSGEEKVDSEEMVCIFDVRR